MTTLQLMYLRERAGGKCGHAAALRRISTKTTLDVETIARCLHRARRADAADAKRAKAASG